MKEEKKVENAISLDLSEIARTNVWVDGDCTKVLKLNLSDMGVMSRLNEVYPKLQGLAVEVSNLQKDASTVIGDDLSLEEQEKKEEEINAKVVDTFNKINNQMKEMVDYIFDFPVSDIVCDGGSMYDMFNGQLRFEYVIERIGALYKANISEEIQRMNKRAEMHTAKYTNSATKKKRK